MKRSNIEAAIIIGTTAIGCGLAVWQAVVNTKKDKEFKEYKANAIADADIPKRIESTTMNNEKLSRTDRVAAYGTLRRCFSDAKSCTRGQKNKFDNYLNDITKALMLFEANDDELAMSYIDYWEKNYERIEEQQRQMHEEAETRNNVKMFADAVRYLKPSGEYNLNISPEMIKALGSAAKNLGGTEC